MLPNVTFTIRAMTLMNLGNAQGSWGPGVFDVTPAGLSNFTCLLWFFSGNRCGVRLLLGERAIQVGLE